MQFSLIVPYLTALVPLAPVLTMPQMLALAPKQITYLLATFGIFVQECLISNQDQLETKGHLRARSGLALLL